MLNKVEELLSNKRFWIVLLLIITAAITAQSILLPLKHFGDDTHSYTHYNNYVIFKNSFYHLLDNTDLYKLHPHKQWDLYKYSPAFALLMAPMALMPDCAGLFFWNALNVFVFFFAFWRMPFTDKRMRWLALAFVLVELITSIQNSQSNALIAGMLMFAFVAMERKQVWLATLLIVGTVYIKLFGLVALALFIFYPQKNKAILYTAFWTIVLALAPLIVVSLPHLQAQYQSWWTMLRADHSVSWGFSVAGWLYTWFGFEMKNNIVLLGAGILLLPLVSYNVYRVYRFRLLFLASILVWVVIFNHKAESPTFIIAIAGVAIWYFTQAPNKFNTVLLLLALVFTVLSPTDIFPREIRNDYIVPYAIKAVPCIAIWCKIVWDMMSVKSAPIGSKYAEK